MKFSIVSLLLLPAYASAGWFKFGMDLSDGSFGSVNSALSPVATVSGESGDVAYGASVHLESDGMPKSFWGEKTSSGNGWNLKTRAEFSQGKYDYDGGDSGAYVTVEAKSDSEETFLWSSAAISPGDGIRGLKVGAKKIVPTDGGKFMFAPRRNFETGTTKVVLGYEKDDTNVFLTFSGDSKDVLVKQTIDDTYSAKLKVGDSGFISASVTSDTDLGATTLTVTPDDLDIEIAKDGWEAGISCDKNLASAEPTVRFRKRLEFDI